MKNILLSLNKTVFAGFILTFVFVAYYFLNNNLLDIYFGNLHLDMFTF